MALKHAEPGPALAVDAASSWRGGPGGLGRSELMRRIGFTLGALIVFRIGTYVPIRAWTMLYWESRIIP